MVTVVLKKENTRFKTCEFRMHSSIYSLIKSVSATQRLGSVTQVVATRVSIGIPSIEIASISIVCSCVMPCFEPLLSSSRRQEDLRLKGVVACEVLLRSVEGTMFDDFPERCERCERHVLSAISLVKGPLKIFCSAGCITGMQALMMPRVISSPDHKASWITVTVKFNFEDGFENSTTL